MKNTPSPLQGAIYNTIQLLEALSNDNLFFTGLNYKPQPTTKDALEYYTSFDNGKIAEDFRERMERKRLEKKP